MVEAMSILNLGPVNAMPRGPRYAARAALLPQRLPDEARAAAPWWFHGQGVHRRMAAAAEATLRAGALCPQGCVITRRCIDIHLPRSSLPCGQRADGAATWHSVNRP